MSTGDILDFNDYTDDVDGDVLNIIALNSNEAPLILNTMPSGDGIVGELVLLEK